MTKTIGKFTYQLIAPRKDDTPLSAIIRIGPQNWSTGEDGWVCLTPDLMSDSEIDYYINAFKKDLERVRRLAKRALKRANEKTLASVAKKVHARKNGGNSH